MTPASPECASEDNHAVASMLEEGRSSLRGRNDRRDELSRISDVDDDDDGFYSTDDVYSDEEEGDDEDEDEEVSLSSCNSGNTDGTPKQAHDHNQYKNSIYLSKLIVFVALIGSIIGASIWTYRFTTHQESNNFQQQFVSQADEIIKVSSNKLSSTVSSLQGFSHAITSLSLVGGGQTTNQSWPWVIVPHFHIRGRDFLKATTATNSGSASAFVQAIAVAPFVEEKDRLEWESFVSFNLTSARHNGDDKPEGANMFIWKQGFRSNGEERLRDYSSGPYLPLSQIYPQDDSTESMTTMINFNLMSNPMYKNLIEIAISTRRSVVSHVLSTDDALIGNLGSDRNGDKDTTPKSILLQPIFKDFGDQPKPEVVAFVVVVLRWDIFLQEAAAPAPAPALPVSDEDYPIVSVLKSQCGDPEEQPTEAYTFRIDGQHQEGRVVFLGEGDHHNTEYDDESYETPISLFENSVEIEDGLALAHDYCTYSLHIYPSNEMMDHFHTTVPLTMTVLVLFIFVFTLLVFRIYVTLVERRNRQVVQAANQTNKIIHNLFPQQVHDRLFNANNNDASNQSNNSSTSQRRRRHGRRRGGKKKFRYQPAKNLLNNFLSDESKKTSSETDDDNTQGGGGSGSGDTSSGSNQSKPIADLFPEATVMFCDIAGFTAWSSVREPSQVFTLLENVYNSFDGIAKRRKVFKVETIGDSYLAVAGLPTPRKDHATVMVRFASDCMTQFDCLCQELETELGPGTSELCMRFGLHSGPVTAGVLRGEKTRFQLFGDTVNTASRMESTGERGKIQVSTATANLLNEAHKRHWCERRKDPVQAKGKGEMITYWVNPKTSVAGGSQASYSNGARTWVASRSLDTGEGTTAAKPAAAKSNESQGQEVSYPDQERNPESTPEFENAANNGEEAVCPKLQRSISFISGVLLALLRQIVARRLAMGRKTIGQTQATRQARMAMQPEPGTLVLDEMEEIISLPKFDTKAARRFVDPETVELPTEVIEQLHSFVTVVALMYQENPFHNFHHATHVTMSVSNFETQFDSKKIKLLEATMA